MIGVVDESTPWLDRDAQRVVYALAMVVGTPEVIVTASSRLRTRLNRRRPFHWESDVGSIVRGVALDELCSDGIGVVVAAAACAAAAQPTTRRKLIEEHLLPAAFELAVDRLVIERQSNAENDADKRTIRDWSRERHRWRPDVEHVDKADARTWLADAASGMWSDALLDRDRHYALRRLAAARTVRSLTWVS